MKLKTTIWNILTLYTGHLKLALHSAVPGGWGFPPLSSHPWRLSLLLLACQHWLLTFRASCFKTPTNILKRGIFTIQEQIVLLFLYLLIWYFKIRFYSNLHFFNGMNIFYHIYQQLVLLWTIFNYILEFCVFLICFVFF